LPVADQRPPGGDAGGGNGSGLGVAPTKGGPEPLSEEPVGYGRPPKAYRFAPGQSGNRRGRPRGVRRVGAILQDVIRQKVAVTENGKTRKVSAIEGMLRRLVNDALRGDSSAMKLLLSLVDRYSASQEAAIKLADMLAEDREILAQYLSQPDAPDPALSPSSPPDLSLEPDKEEEDNDVAV
jgi:Family of unknown function (DUF5681)